MSSHHTLNCIVLETFLNLHALSRNLLALRHCPRRNGSSVISISRLSDHHLSHKLSQLPSTKLYYSPCFWPFDWERKALAS
jgi:hypothetical protein